MRLLAVSLVFGIATSVCADFPELFNTEPEPETAWMSADEAAAAMQVPEGFRVTAFAAEPDIQNPIACSWDSRGRLWVAENYTYAERTQKFQLDLRDRVVILDGTDQDKFTKRTVFTDEVQMLTGIEVGRGGVWLMCPPQLLFIPDANHDDVPDAPAKVVLDGFEVADANYHNFANGLRFGPDGWLYGRCGGSCPGRIGKPGTPDEQRLALEGGIWRYHPDRGGVEVLTTGTTNPWGHDWNAVGEAFYVNTVNGHLWHMIPGAHFTRPFTLDPNGKTYELIDFHADHWHFDTGGAWHESRDGVANAYGGGHAHCGTMIYQGGNWPKQYHGRLFTLNFHGRRANQEILKREGAGYVASHGEDTFIAADPWFRGMEITSGPDGNAFILDWSDAGECHEHTGVHRTSGRVYKVSWEQPGEVKADVRTWDAVQLADSVLHPNAWYRRQAKIELASRGAAGQNLAKAIARLLRIIAQTDHNEHPEHAIHARLMLHILGSDRTRRALVKGSSNGDRKLVSKNEYARAWEIRLQAESLPIDDAMGVSWKSPLEADRLDNEVGPLITRLRTAAEHDESARVHLVVASTLQRLPIKHRAPIAALLSQHEQYNDDHNLPLMVWYGLMPVAQQSPADLVAVARACRLDVTLRLICRSLAEQVKSHPEPFNDLLQVMLRTAGSERRKVMLTGVTEGLKGWVKAPRPDCWDQVMSIQDQELQPMIRELSVVFGDGRALDELKAIATGKVDADPEMRHSALRTLIQSNADGLQAICEGLLKDARMNVIAASGLAKFDDPQIGKSLVSRYRNFRAPQRPKLMAILVSRKSFAMPLLDAIESGRIARADLTPYQARQLMALEDPQLSDRVREVWGEIRDTPEAIQAKIVSLKQTLTTELLSSANKSQGRSLFAKHCQTCHKLYGEGQNIGPDLTGSDRGNLDYLLDNIVSPSSVVDKDFRMTLLLLDDDRIVSGLVTEENDRVLTLRTTTEELKIDKDTVLTRKVTEKSPMPDGLLDSLSEQDIADLIAYLRHPAQVALETAVSK